MALRLNKEFRALPKASAARDELYKIAKDLPGNHLISRHQQQTCHSLDLFDYPHRKSGDAGGCQPVPLNKIRPCLPKEGGPLCCYQCNKAFRRPHAVYFYCCHACGERNQAYRHLSRNLAGQTAVVTGARTKLGHQVALKLLRAGCARVVCTTRAVEKARALFEAYPDYEIWREALILYPLDLDSPSMDQVMGEFVRFLRGEAALDSVDILVNCAAQTIRARDKPDEASGDSRSPEERNRYGDSKFVRGCDANSWEVEIDGMDQRETEECYRVNAEAPALLIKHLLPLLRSSTVVNGRKKELIGTYPEDDDPFLSKRQMKRRLRLKEGNQRNARVPVEGQTIGPHIVNVHAREGRFEIRRKNDLHLHTNMAKAALAMVTKCLQQSASMVTNGGARITVHGVDPGWISVDEYFENAAPFNVPPLDEIDGAARILFPVWRGLPGCPKTRVHFYTLQY